MLPLPSEVIPVSFSCANANVAFIIVSLPKSMVSLTKSSVVKPSCANANVALAHCVAFSPDIVSLIEPSGVIAPSCANTFTNAVVDIPAVAIKANARIDGITIE